ncbi:hypothetical protein HMPREF1071_01512 [Bacteroides salyersiae CL02T12C01]|uniref:TonB-dependent receptor plug domain-containing protein n=1 Tax=Bacteroides salyersiae CL02T12C01 TaxID=997887 RepID=I9I049_9BACE|nr:hypothetical protein [Bacteroides salyersiae]EIY66154.1 hypothetical protein HMPREF1071_01512 [Bacteroides salyersiae CL02T12C01]
MKKVILLSMQFVCFFVVSFLLTQTTLAQGNSTVTGKVLDSLGESVIGASVLVKGTTSGTITMRPYRLHNKYLFGKRLG